MSDYNELEETVDLMLSAAINNKTKLFTGNKAVEGSLQKLIEMVVASVIKNIHDGYFKYTIAINNFYGRRHIEIKLMTGYRTFVNISDDSQKPGLLITAPGVFTNVQNASDLVNVVFTTLTKQLKEVNLIQ